MKLRHSHARTALTGLFVLLMSATHAVAQPAAGRFVDHTFRDGNDEHKYVVFVPAGYRADKPSPAVMYLHGAAERGKDNRLQLTNGLAPYVQARAQTFPFLVIFPQCEQTEGRILDSWKADQPGGRQALLALDDSRRHYNFDTKRVTLTGWSMGGYGVWSLAQAEPQRWSALVPIAGGGSADQIATLKGVPVWAFHGAKDALIKAEAGRKMVDALKEAGGTATYTEIADGGHDITEQTYGSEALFKWILNPKNAATEQAGATVKPVSAVTLPFVPAVEVSQAVGLRLGNEVLDALSYSIPQTISPQLLTGQLNDMFDSTVASGRQFNIRFGGITYYGQLERVACRGYGKDRLLVQLGIRNVAITIGGTSVTGARHSAQAGPIAIRIGQRYPVWFNLELTPYVVDRRIRLKLVSAGFQIPQDNWSVSQPAGVSVHGFGMTQEAVVSGLVNGLYGAKGRIEGAVVSIAPQIVQEIEKSLVLPDTSAAVAQLWPLPSYPPRIQAWPQQISTDENGISLVVGMTIASIDPFAPPKALQHGTGAGVALTQLPSDKLLHVAVAPGILESLTRTLIGSNQAQLDLMDIPEPLFARLADRDTLKQIIPDLAQYGDGLQVRSTLRITKPITLTTPQKVAEANGAKPLELQLPAVQVSVSIKTSAEQVKWQPCAVFHLDLSEQIAGKLEKPAHDERVIELDLLPASNVTGSGKFAEGYEAKNQELKSDQYVEQFAAAWKAYCSSVNDAAKDVPDLSIGSSKMRLAKLDWGSPTIDLTYQLARIKLTNLSKEIVTYQTKSPTSAWGQPLQLKPGASHEFEIPYPLTYQRILPNATEVYTLNVGSNSEFRIPATGGVPRLFTARRTTPESRNQ